MNKRVTIYISHIISDDFDSDDQDIINLSFMDNMQSIEIMKELEEIE